MNEQLIFFGLIIAFSILDGIVRRKRGTQVPPPEEWEGGDEWQGSDDREGSDEVGDPGPVTARESRRGEDAPEGFEDDLTSYQRRGASVSKYEAPGGSGSVPGTTPPSRYQPPRTSSPVGDAQTAESVWEEIARLARAGGVPPDDMPGDAPYAESPPRLPGTSRRPGSDTSRLPRSGRSVVRRSGVPARGAPSQEHPIHLSHAGYGTDPSSRPSNAAVVTSEQSSEDVKAVKRMLAGGRGQLRRAVILQEMLGPPVSMRDAPDHL